jgi:hypothetical protein
LAPALGQPVVAVLKVMSPIRLSPPPHRVCEGGDDHIEGLLINAAARGRSRFGAGGIRGGMA